MNKSWMRRRPLQPTPGTRVVQPIGEATEDEIAEYAAGREAERIEQDLTSSDELT